MSGVTGAALRETSHINKRYSESVPSLFRLRLFTHLFFACSFLPFKCVGSLLQFTVMDSEVVFNVPYARSLVGVIVIIIVISVIFIQCNKYHSYHSLTDSPT